MGYETDREGLYVHREAYNGALKAGDLEGWLATLTDDCVFLPPGAPALKGKDAIRTWAGENMFSVFDVALEYDFEEVDFVGSTAQAWGWFDQTLTPKDGSEPLRIRGKFLDVFQPDEAGDWKLARCAYNADHE
jgi:uncharacterized protein (TIGR02246 family)